jgi:hypothetical protein
MAKKKISGLPAGSALNGTELVPIVQAGTTKRTTAQDIANLGNASGVEGSGTINRLPKFTASSTIGDSKFFDDGTNQGTETTTAVNRFIMSANASIAKIFSFRSANLPRWAFRVDGTESGANAGADLAIRRYNDAGTYIDSPLFIKRSTGNIGINTIAPSEELELYKSQNATTRLLINNPDSTNTSSRASLIVNSNGVIAEMVTINTLGLYLGTTSNHRTSIMMGGTEYLGINGTNGRIQTNQAADTGETFIIGGSARVNGSVISVQTAATQATSEYGNANTQGTAQLQKIVRQYSAVSLGTKLIIPFVSQTSLNSTTFVRIIGHAARFNSPNPLGFSAEFAVGHLNTLSSLTTLNSSGNVLSIAINGMNIEITFVFDYTFATSSGLYTTIEYMTNAIEYSIDVPNIAMN